MRTFCLDTSVLINGWHKHYRIDVFPEVWDRIGHSIESSRSIICWEVWKEIERFDDTLHKWLIPYRPSFFQPNDEHTGYMRALMAKYPQLANASHRKNAADPWVVTTAQCWNAIVVTYEGNEETKPTKPPKIPQICAALDVACTKPIDYIAMLSGIRTA